MSQKRISTSVYLLVVFLCGAVAGSFGHRLYMMNSVKAESTPDDYRRRYVEEMRTRLKLDEGQVAKIGVIFDDTRRKVRELYASKKPEMKVIQDEQTSRINGMLNEKQQQEYRRFQQEREANRRSRSSGGGGLH